MKCVFLIIVGSSTAALASPMVSCNLRQIKNSSDVVVAVTETVPGNQPCFSTNAKFTLVFRPDSALVFDVVKEPLLPGGHRERRE